MGTSVRVVHVITRMIVGGAQENTLHTCDGLHQNPDWDVLLLTGPPLGPEGELLTEVEQRRIPHRVIPELRRAINPWHDAVALLKLIRQFQAFRPTIVHTHSSKAGILGRLAAFLTRVPIVIHTIEGLPFHRYACWYTNAPFVLAERIAAHMADRISCVAQAIIEQALQAGVGRRDRFALIHSGMDVDAFYAARAERDNVRSRFGFGPDDIVIGKVARLFKLKGHRFVIDAAPQIIKRCPRARFLFVGDGVLREHLAAQAAGLSIRDRFVFAGLVPPQTIPAVINAMDVVVHASLREGLARVLVQALLCEKPVVTCELDGAPEVILDGVTGRLVPPETVDELAEAVIWTVEHMEQARRMAREGNRRFADLFRIETMVADTAQLYRELLAAKGIQP